MRLGACCGCCGASSQVYITGQSDDTGDGVHTRAPWFGQVWLDKLGRALGFKGFGTHDANVAGDNGGGDSPRSARNRLGEGIVAGLQRWRGRSPKAKHERKRWKRPRVPARDATLSGPNDPSSYAVYFVEDFWGRFWSADPGGRWVLQFIASIRIQCLVRRYLSRLRAQHLLSTALAAQTVGETMRNDRRREERSKKILARAVYREEGVRILRRAVQSYLAPWAAVDVQRIYRGHLGRHLARKRLADLLDELRRRRERERYMRALRRLRKDRRRPFKKPTADKNRRVWGREDFGHTGWQPGAAAAASILAQEGSYTFLEEHTYAPPVQTAAGLRVGTVKLPPETDWDKELLKRAGQESVPSGSLWVGVPISTHEKSPPRRLGPPPRPGTITAHGLEPFGSTRESTSRGSTHTRAAATAFVTKYTWLPASMVVKGMNSPPPSLEIEVNDSLFDENMDFGPQTV